LPATRVLPSDPTAREDLTPFHEDHLAKKTSLSIEIRHYIEQHLGDHTMTPASIAEAHNISKRYLHKIFEREGNTVGGQIRTSRLEKIRKDLANPLLADRPVGAVGARWGLVDPSQLSRLFREVYGLSPREYRVKAAADRETLPRFGDLHVSDDAPTPTLTA
jgi:AraC-like DNA-binding protein